MNEKQSNVYLSLLKMKECTVAQLAKDTSLNRSLLYFVLNDMEKAGFVVYVIKNNVKYYKPVEPERILSYLDDKKRGFESILPELIQMTKFSKVKPQIEILEGVEGIKTILNEILRLKENWYAFNVPGKGPEVIGFVSDSFENLRQKLKIKLRVICNDAPKAVERANAFSKMKHTEVRILGGIESLSSNYIYGDRFVIIFWYKEFPFAVRIIDKVFANSQRSYFEQLWKVAKSLR
jgi:sugar-specific transcriptional regulator TrmB